MARKAGNRSRSGGGSRRSTSANPSEISGHHSVEPEIVEDTPDVEIDDLHPAADSEADSPAEPRHEVSVEETGDDEHPAVEENTALVPLDPLSRYLAEVRRFPLLTREEETVIAKRYHTDHDPEDAYRLVTANLRLVVKIALEFARASRNVLDLIQEGNVGLMEAVKNFDPYRGIRFPSYAVWWVRAYIYRYLINNWRLVKIGTTQAQRKLFFNLRKETERLRLRVFAPSPSCWPSVSESRKACARCRSAWRRVRSARSTHRPAEDATWSTSCPMTPTIRRRPRRPTNGALSRTIVSGSLRPL